MKRGVLVLCVLLLLVPASLAFSVDLSCSPTTVSAASTFSCDLVYKKTTEDVQGLQFKLSYPSDMKEGATFVTNPDSNFKLTSISGNAVFSPSSVISDGTKLATLNFIAGSSSGPLSVEPIQASDANGDSLKSGFTKTTQTITISTTPTVKKDKDGCVVDWSYYSADGKTKYGGPFNGCSNIAYADGTYWCATKEANYKRGSGKEGVDYKLCKGNEKKTDMQKDLKCLSSFYYAKDGKIQGSELTGCGKHAGTSYDWCALRTEKVDGKDAYVSGGIPGYDWKKCTPVSKPPVVAKEGESCKTNKCDTGLSCIADTCAKADGTEGSACDSSNLCDTGLECTGNKCVKKAADKKVVDDKPVSKIGIEDAIKQIKLILQNSKYNQLQKVSLIAGVLKQHLG